MMYHLLSGFGRLRMRKMKSYLKDNTKIKLSKFSSKKIVYLFIF